MDDALALYGLERALPDGRLVGVQPMLFGNARLWVGDATGIANSY